MKIEGLIVYVPANKPLTDEQKQADPFSIYVEWAVFFRKTMATSL